ncbi:ImmA/IrrE family metallo-endopeptidase [Pseudoflavitalea sp. X16]|uniref:ImmA/IrrE family metallo-endopeptidase n=1 Tax=Paraflavitalea devenefica TaxID=2716334 RepID=UPI00142116B6|nr:ImmA/IrrE family metallo-endopeptidase [Paraflavitalea devenefica]NII27926.1 ImmA/IrrE family metallo-endopeptidase [Paraflavitalea devenefica]
MVSFNDKILEVRATKFRDSLGISNADPIDLYKVLAELNVVTNFRRMGPEFSGMALKIGKDSKFILVNSEQARSRQHFTIGHELYHLFVQPDFSFMLCKTGRFNKKDREEYNADVFSSFLLMPEVGVLSCIPEEELARGGQISLPTIVKLEQHFGVSRRALLVRLDKLGLIDYEGYSTQYLTGIKRSANQLGYSTRLYEAGSDYNMIGDYGMVCKKLFEEEKISESHYFNLMFDIGVNIDQKFEENDDEW